MKYYRVNFTINHGESSFLQFTAIKAATLRKVYTIAHNYFKNFIDGRSNTKMRCASYEFFNGEIYLSDIYFKEISQADYNALVRLKLA